MLFTGRVTMFPCDSLSRCIQTLLTNYEATLVEYFGQDDALGTELRFPPFVSSITGDAAEAVKALRSQIPRGVLDWVQDFDASLEAGETADQKFDFRIYIVPHKGPKSTADAAMTFVREDEMTSEQIAVLDQVQTIIRGRHVPVEDLNGLRVGQVVEQVSPQLSRPFTQHMHTQAWRYFRVRPATNADKTATKSDFCHYNSASDQYTYTPQWVTYLIRHLSDENTYNAVCRGGLRTSPS